MGRKPKVVVSENASGELQVTIAGVNYEIHTDADVQDIASICFINEKTIWDALYEYPSIGTPCEGCANVGLRDMFPCISCSRNEVIKDYYKASK